MYRSLNPVLIEISELLFPAYRNSNTSNRFATLLFLFAFAAASIAAFSASLIVIIIFHHPSIIIAHFLLRVCELEGM